MFVVPRKSGRQLTVESAGYCQTRGSNHLPGGQVPVRTPLSFYRRDVVATSRASDQSCTDCNLRNRVTHSCHMSNVDCVFSLWHYSCLFIIIWLKVHLYHWYPRSPLRLVVLLVFSIFFIHYFKHNLLYLSGCLSFLHSIHTAKSDLTQWFSVPYLFLKFQLTSSEWNRNYGSCSCAL